MQNKNFIYPVQPYFVLRTSKYFKKRLIGSNVAQFYHFFVDVAADDLTLVPDDCINILFTCDSEHPDAQICGTVFNSTPLSIQSGAYYFGMRFVPGTILHNINISNTELVNHQISLFEVCKTKDVIEKIIMEKNFEKQIDLFVHGFSEQIQFNSDSLDKSLIFCILDMIYQARGDIKVNELALKTGYSSRYIDKLFHNQIGINPKKFCQIVKFQTIIQQLNHGWYRNLTDLSLNMGYYDQSHLLKDFKKFTAMSPKKYIDEIMRANYLDKIIEI